MKHIFTLLIFFLAINLYAQNKQAVTHTVVPGNTLFSISKQYGVSVDDIKQWNNMSSFSLKAGQQLIVGYNEMSQNTNAPVKTGEITKPEITKPITQPAINAQATITNTSKNEVPTNNTVTAKKETIEDIGFSISDTKQADYKSITDLIPTSTENTGNKLIFCGGVENDKPVGVSSVFYNNRGQNYVYVFIEKDTAFNFKSLYVDLFSVNEKNEKTKQATNTYEVKPKWKYTMFKYFIDKPGLYELAVFDENKRKMGTGSVRILP